MAAGATDCSEQLRIVDGSTPEVVYLGESPRITPMATRRRPWPWWLGALAPRYPEATFLKCWWSLVNLER